MVFNVELMSFKVHSSKDSGLESDQNPKTVQKNTTVWEKLRIAKPMKQAVSF